MFAKVVPNPGATLTDMSELPPDSQDHVDLASHTQPAGAKRKWFREKVEYCGSFPYGSELGGAPDAWDFSEICSLRGDRIHGQLGTNDGSETATVEGEGSSKEREKRLLPGSAHAKTPQRRRLSAASSESAKTTQRRRPFNASSEESSEREAFPMSHLPSLFQEELGSHSAYGVPCCPSPYCEELSHGNGHLCRSSLVGGGPDAQDGLRDTH